MLLEAWKDQEEKIGEADEIEKVTNEMPRRVKKQRRIRNIEGETEEEAGIFIYNNFLLIEIGWEEYYDYIFPDDDNQLRNIKILEKARRWKEMMAAKNKGTADENPEEIADV